MPDQDKKTFQDLIARIRAGDEAAARELVQDYEPLVRREIRVRMTDRRIARMFDSIDVCQSIWSSFFVRAAAGQYDLESPGHLARLLLTMAKNKLTSQARRHQNRKRDVGRIDVTGSALVDVTDNNPSPSACVSAKELFAQLHDRLTEEERKVSVMRREGYTWDEVAREIGGTPQSRRMQLARAADRVISQLGLDE